MTTVTTAPTEAQPDSDPVQRLAALIEERRDIEAAIERAGDDDNEDLVIRLLARRQVLPGRIARAIVPALEFEIAAHAATIEHADAASATIAAELPEAEAAVAAAEAALETVERARAAIQARLGAAQRVRSDAIGHTRDCRVELERQRDPQRRPSGELTGTRREGVLALVDQVAPRAPRTLPSSRFTVLGNPHAAIPDRPPVAAPTRVAGPHEEVVPGVLQISDDGGSRFVYADRPQPSTRHSGGVAGDEPLPA